MDRFIAAPFVDMQIMSACTLSVRL